MPGGREKYLAGGADIGSLMSAKVGTPESGAAAEARLAGQLQRNNLPSAGTPTVTPEQ